MTRNSQKRSLDMMAGLDAAGHKLAGKANARLERAPMRVPVGFLLAGASMLIGAAVLAGIAADMGPGTRVYETTRLFASVLYGVGGISILVGLAGLLSALAVHIVEKKERSR